MHYIHCYRRLKQRLERSQALALVGSHATFCKASSMVYVIVVILYTYSVDVRETNGDTGLDNNSLESIWWSAKLPWEQHQLSVLSGSSWLRQGLRISGRLASDMTASGTGPLSVSDPILCQQCPVPGSVIITKFCTPNICEKGRPCHILQKVEAHAPDKSSRRFQ